MKTKMLSLVLASTMTGCAAQPTPVTPSNDQHNDMKWRDTGWVSTGIGGVAGIVALGTGYVMLHDQSVRSSACNAQKQCTQEGLDANSQLRSLQDWNTGAWIVAAVGLGVGAFLVIKHPPRERDKNEPQPPADQGETAIGVGPGGLTVRRSF